MVNFSVFLSGSASVGLPYNGSGLGEVVDF